MKEHTALERCQAKRVYNNWLEAEKAAILLIEDIRDGKLKRQKNGNNIMAYRCVFCNRWHIGHAWARNTRRAVHRTGTEGWMFGWQLTQHINFPLVKRDLRV